MELILLYWVIGLIIERRLIKAHFEDMETSVPANEQNAHEANEKRQRIIFRVLCWPLT